MPPARCMMMGWMILTAVWLLPACRAGGPQPHPRVATLDGRAAVPCHLAAAQPFPEEVRLTLLKGLDSPHRVCSAVLNLSRPKEKHGTELGERNLKCSAQVNLDVLEVTLSGLAATDTDVYRCVSEVLLPPPYVQYTANATLVHVIERSECPLEAPLRQVAQSHDQEQNQERVETQAVNLPVGILVVLVILVLLAIIFLQVRQGRTEAALTVSAINQKRNTAVSCDIA